MHHDHNHDAHAHGPGCEHDHAGHDHAEQGHDHAEQGSHDHAHAGHGHHGHSHAPASFGRAFAVGIALNTLLVVAQFGVGAWAHSTALLADAVHNLGDVLGLAFAWLAAHLGQRGPTERRTYGWGRSSILAALANATVLLIGTGAITVEAVQRLLNPAPVAGPLVMMVAALGILVNGGVALMFMRGREKDLNIKGAFMHMAADAGVSAGVVVAAAIITFTGALWLDPAASLAISAVIVVGSWGLLRDATALAMDAVPPGIDTAAVRSRLLALPGVTEVHDLHIWALSTTSTAATAHLVTGVEAAGLVPQACTLLRTEFGISHCTFQLESPDLAERCALRPEHVV
ncbi:cation diffusion facilitator family transporter [Acidisphaera sp. L21]|uniref:cation diffusion facilitator family transporter n=1 Tax=Acidisphaera sp. L21 TaxID=1641851 RepID=UPI00131B5AC6|nr:cation diffusion facilitator family transporter [Acidisphaera sp. L21]